ncbi:unnamed protein product [Urochloa humidicola]
MAGRFLFQNLPSGMSSRSRKHLSAHASAYARDVARITRRFLEGGAGTLNSLLQGSAAYRSMAIGSNTAVHHYEGRIATISNVLRGAPAQSSAATHDNCGFRGHAMRYLYTLPRSSPAVKTSSPTTAMPLLITHGTKPCVGSVGVKPTSSSNSSTEKADFEPNSACKAEIEAAEEASHAALAAWKAEVDKLTSSFDSLVTSMAIIWTVAALYCIVRVYLASSRGGKDKRAQFAESDNVAVGSSNVP